MEKYAINFGWWFLCALCDGAGANEEELKAWEELKKVLLPNEKAKSLIIEVEYVLKREGYRG